MGVTYYKRYRMEVDLRHDWRRPAPPRGYRYAPWSEEILLEHAEAKYAAFHGSVDADVFTCLGHEDGCLRLMEEIVSKPGFLPEATWLILRSDPDGIAEPVGTIQGIRVTPRYGAIQNVGVAPWERGRGVGRALVLAALAGFRSAGLQRAMLEVTATNIAAVRMYESIGFHRTKTSYRAVETPVASRSLQAVTASGS